VNLVRATRASDPLATDKIRKYIKFGASVRATMSITLAAKARALLAGRYHVTHEDIRSIAPPVLRHRMLANYHAESDGVTVDDVLNDLLKQLSE
jgi:MoxR-like ATPase